MFVLLDTVMSTCLLCRSTSKEEEARWLCSTYLLIHPAAKDMGHARVRVKVLLELRPASSGRANSKQWQVPEITFTSPVRHRAAATSSSQARASTESPRQPKAATNSPCQPRAAGDGSAPDSADVATKAAAADSMHQCQVTAASLTGGDLTASSQVQNNRNGEAESGPLMPSGQSGPAEEVHETVAEQVCSRQQQSCLPM